MQFLRSCKMDQQHYKNHAVSQNTPKSEQFSCALCKISKFQLISQCRNLMKMYNFRTAANMCFNQISRSGNQVKLNYLMQWWNTYEGLLRLSDDNKLHVVQAHLSKTLPNTLTGNRKKNGSWLTTGCNLSASCSSNVRY